MTVHPLSPDAIGDGPCQCAAALAAENAVSESAGQWDQGERGAEVV